MDKFGIDTRVDTEKYALFFYLLATDEEFYHSTWDNRVEIFKYDYHIDICSSTLSKWTKKMIEMNIFSKEKTQSKPWVTKFIGKIKSQLPVNLDDEQECEEMSKYFDRRKDLLNAADEEYCKALGIQEGKNPNRWKKVSFTLWEEFHHTCYYPVTPFVYNKHFTDDTIRELFELCQEIFNDIPKFNIEDCE